ncbi:hypothetical protein WR25_16810 [Diploscapter pachys]|uniref:SXP/RAL-2 family protein Ani s 5-like cation-binding domain-containing protein n=1 Tax=Diploscapter pachys TaxID=2018661 RepID=A0A2A2K7A3_9BILA|nr:hypothetical protein WR25_16810 [Diploscapter pachys]
MLTKIALIALFGTTVLAQRGGWQMGQGAGSQDGQNGMAGWSNNQNGGGRPPFGGPNSGPGFPGSGNGNGNFGPGFGPGNGGNEIDGSFPFPGGNGQGPRRGGFNPYDGSDSRSGEMLTGPGGMRNGGGPFGGRGGRKGGHHGKGGMGKFFPFLKDVTPECRKDFFETMKNATANNETITQLEQTIKDWAARCNATQAYEEFEQKAEQMMQEISKNVDALIQSLAGAKSQLEQILNNKDITPKELADQMRQFIQQNPQQFAALGFLAKLSSRQQPPVPGMSSTAMPVPMPVATSTMAAF